MIYPKANLQEIPQAALTKIRLEVEKYKSHQIVLNAEFFRTRIYRSKK